MSHNPEPSLDAAFALPGHRILALEGADAVAFAQAQFMNDVAVLEDGHWQWNGWLTPKGRVVVLFALLRMDAHTLWLLLPDVGAEELATLLQRFVFRSKVKFSAVDQQVSGQFTSPHDARDARFALPETGVLELDMGGEGGPRRLRIGATTGVDDTQAVDRWIRADLAHGLPRLPASQRERWTPQQLSLERLRAFSIRKGCYPGQEIVARTHFLGQAKRGLALLEIARNPAGELAAGSEVQMSGRGIGGIVCASGNLALAVLPLEMPEDGLDVAGTALQARPLLGGLAR